MITPLKKPVVYVARDIERALGRAPGNGYFVVSNDTAYGREVAAKHPGSVYLVKGSTEKPEPLDTFDLLKRSDVEEIIEKHDADVLVFQNNPRIERLCAERGWRLLNPSATLARTVEEKVSQIAWLGTDAELLPPHRLNTVGKVDFVKASTAKGGAGKFVLQFNHSHTGEGTFIIESAEQLAALAAKFPDRECRAVKFISGPVLTMNVVAGPMGAALGSTSYQITGLKPFTDLPFSTIGNDWALPSDADRAAVSNIARRISRRMRRAGWRGLFGIDVIKDEKTGEVFLLEINARQPASTTYESQLAAAKDPERMTIFDAHLASLLAGGLNVYTRALAFCPVARVREGAQVVQRVTTEPKRVDVAALRALPAPTGPITVIAYGNAGHNKDLFRIQSPSGIMGAHNALNEGGNAIAACIL